MKEKTLLTKVKSNFIQELENQVQQGQELYNRKIADSGSFEQLKKDYRKWTVYNEELLKRSFNSLDNEYYYKYSNCTNFIGVEDVIYRRNTSGPAYEVKLMKEKIEASFTNLEELISIIPLIEGQENINHSSTATKSFSNKCFIVHGHNESRKYEVTRFIENDLKKPSIILHEKPNQGRTIIEKFEHYAKVDFAVAIWTADDLGKANTEKNYKNRTRQNVVFETGFFIGKLGRENVIVLYEDDVDIPSDYSGVLFIKLADNWKDDLRKEVEAIYNN